MSIEHDIANEQFTLQSQGQKSVLQYRLLGESAVDFVHTYVPPALRGQGHAARLVDAGIEWAQQRKLRIEASCWYVARRLASG